MRYLFTVLCGAVLWITTSSALAAGALDKYLWVPNYYDNTVSKVDVDSHTVVATISVATNPAGIAVGREYAYVTHRNSSCLYRISKTADAVYDSIDLSAVMVLPIGVAIDPGGYAFVVGRRHFGASGSDSAYLTKVNPQGVIEASAFVEIIDASPGDASMRRIGIGLNANGHGFVPWTRAMNSNTGIVQFSTNDLSWTNYHISLFFYRGPGVGIDQIGNGWTAGCRLNTASFVKLVPNVGLAHYPMDGGWEERRGDVLVDPEQFVWVTTILGLFKLNPETQEVTQFAVGAGGGGIACDINGYIWTTFPDSNKVKKFDLSGNQIGASVEVGNYPLGYGDMTGYEFGYICGDVSGDGVVSVGDVVYLVSYLYKGGPAPDPLWVGDANSDGIVNVGDVIWVVNYLYKDGPAPCEPPGESQQPVKIGGLK